MHGELLELLNEKHLEPAANSPQEFRMLELRTL
jgi:hypothetical protein